MKRIVDRYKHTDMPQLKDKPKKNVAQKKEYQASKKVNMELSPPVRKRASYDLSRTSQFLTRPWWLIILLIHLKNTLFLLFSGNSAL